MKVPIQLAAFAGKLNALLRGGKPDLTHTEKMWVSAFYKAAAPFLERYTLDDLFWGSFDALRRCYESGRADTYGYVLRACGNAHKDRVRQDRAPRPRFDGSYNPWFDVDARLDLKDALRKMKRLQPTYAKAFRMRLDGCEFKEIGERLDVPVKTAERLVLRAETLLRRLLGGAYADG